MAIEGLKDIMKADSARATKMDCTQSVEEYINREDWRIAANSNTSYSQAGLVNNLAGKAIANYFLDKLYTKKEGDSHRKAEYHIHDLDVLAAYCCGHDLQKLLNEGFNGVSGRVGSKAPKHFREALYQMANFIGILQAEWAGAQAFSSFDTYLAPLVFFDKHFCGVRYDELKKAVRNFVYNLNVPSRWGQCVPSSYKALKADGTWVSHEDLKVGDEIYVYDVEKQVMTHDTITHVNVFESPEIMHKYTADTDEIVGDLSFMVTPNHKVLHNMGSGEYTLADSADLFGKEGIHIPQIIGTNVHTFINREVTVAEATPKTEKVWCPTTNTGTFVCMTDEGYVFLTGNSPFSNITIDLKCPNDLKDRNPMRADQPFFVSVWEEYKPILDRVQAWKDAGEEGEAPDYNDIDTYNRWQLLIKALRDRMDDHESDEETLLYSACYKHFDAEMKVVFKAYYEVMGEGDAFGLPFTFPIPTVNLTEDFDWDNPDYDVLWEQTAKYGSSYFQNFVGSQYLRDENGELTIRDENAYSPNDIRSMCCRLQLDKKALRKRGGGLFGSDSQTGSVGVVTINLARLGYEYRGNEKGLREKLFKLMDRASNTLDKKRAFVKEMVLRGLYPYTRRYINSAKEGFSTFFSTIGVNGMNECIRNFTNDEHDISDEWGQKWALKLMGDINARLLKYQDETGNLYNLEASPGEGCLAYETGILTIDGTKEIGSLVGQNVPVLSWNKTTRELEYKNADIVFDSVTENVYKITFDNGYTVECTSQHPFGIRHWNGKRGEEVCWVPAEDLKVGDRVKSVYPRLSQHGYQKYSHRFFVHRERYKFYNGEIPDGCVIHHKDGNKLNNEISNLELLTDSEHRRLHISERLADGSMQVSQKGELNNFWGKHHTEESRKKISENRCRLSESEKKMIRLAYGAGMEFKQISRLMNMTTQPLDYIRSCGLERDGMVDHYPAQNPSAIEFLFNNGYEDEQIVDILRGHNKIEYVRDVILGLTEQNHKVVSVEVIQKKMEVYNAMVEDNRNFFIGDDENGYVLTHNTTYRFAKEDQKAFGRADKVYVRCPEHGLVEVDVKDGESTLCPHCGAALIARRGIIQAGIPEAPYYTNSTQLPVDFGEDVFSALDLQDDLQKSYSGGTVFHIYSEEDVNGNQVKNLIRKVVSNYRLPYVSYTASFSTCPKHGRIPGLHEFCPLCDQELLTKHYSEWDPNKG